MWLRVARLEVMTWFTWVEWLHISNNVMSNVPSQDKNWHTSTKDIHDQAEMTRNMKPVFLPWWFFLPSWLPSFVEIRLKRLHPRFDCEQTSTMTVFGCFQNHPKTHLISSDHFFKILHVVVVVAAFFSSYLPKKGNASLHSQSCT